MGRVDLAILQEIVRVVQAKAVVPEKISLQKRSYALTYLEDHRQRMEEALRRHDPDRVNMLFGQLASKVKYQLIRPVLRPSAASAKTKGGKSKAGPRSSKPPARKAAARRATTRKR